MTSGNDNANANGNVNPDKWKAALSLTKRTQQLDDAREVLITHTATGQPIWTTAGQNRMTAADKEELSANLAAQRRGAAVQEATKRVLDAASKFLEHSIMELAPPPVMASYTGELADDGATFGDWLENSGFAFKQDGLRSVLLHGGKEVASFTAKVNPAIEDSVVQMLRFEHSLANSMLGGGQ